MTTRKTTAKSAETKPDETPAEKSTEAEAEVESGKHEGDPEPTSITGAVELSEWNAEDFNRLYTAVQAEAARRAPEPQNGAPGSMFGDEWLSDQPMPWAIIEGDDSFDELTRAQLVEHRDAVIAELDRRPLPDPAEGAI